jgi:hypothetical protein
LAAAAGVPIHYVYITSVSPSPFVVTAEVVSTSLNDIQIDGLIWRMRQVWYLFDTGLKK